MTTIATDGRTMIADGQITANNIVIALDCEKMVRLPDGRVMGMAGALANCEIFHQWVLDGADRTKMPEGLEEDFEAIIIDGSTRVLCIDHLGRTEHLSAPYVCGSGCQLAMGAMLAGASLRDAVKVATTRDCYSGGKIRTMTVKSTSV